MLRRSFVLTVFTIGLCVTTLQAQVTRPSVPGVTNFAKVESTIACAGAVTPAGVAELKKLGYASIINLRLANEAGANLEEEAAAARSVGISYISLPFNTASPDLTVIDRFLAAVTAKENQPVMVHCASGNRAAALWMIKRVQVDKWDVERASTEAAALGLTSPALKTFVLDYLNTHKS